uniref:Tyr recombinase domain-containing protein n=1 Tax=Amphimedon queenslandica TaxID=400682 RepID=A0A1X7UMP2_AMPQE
MNNSGGLCDRKLRNEVVNIIENKEKPQRPPSETTQALYLQPLQNPIDDCWYANEAVGHNPLRSTVKKLIKMAKEDGYFTSHSLQRTCATNLYSKGINEQQIMSVTGRRSIDAVRLYKEISDEQKRHMSQVLQLKNEEDICETEVKSDVKSLYTAKEALTVVFSSGLCEPLGGETGFGNIARATRLSPPVRFSDHNDVNLVICRGVVNQLPAN